VKINDIHIYLSTWFPSWCQGFTLNSKIVFVKYVFDPSKRKVHVDSTIDVIQHELNHCKKIKEKGWIDFMFTMLWQYIWKKHDKAGYEPDAEKAEKLPNDEIRPLLIDKLNKVHLEYY